MRCPFCFLSCWARRQTRRNPPHWLPPGRISRIPLPDLATSRTRPRKTPEPHISRSQKGEIAGKRPVFQGLEMGILTLSGRSSGAARILTGSGKVAVRVHSPCSRNLVWPERETLSRKRRDTCPLYGRPPLRLDVFERCSYTGRRGTDPALSPMCPFSRCTVQFNRILASAPRRKNSYIVGRESFAGFI